MGSVNPVAGTSPFLEGQDATFEILALEVLRHQAQAHAAYGRLIRARGLDPLALTHWWDFPPIPVRGFREGGDGPGRSPFIGDPDQAEAVFLTSGTTGGHEARGVHKVRDLSLYHRSLLAWARHGLGVGEGGLRILALLPPPDLRPESSLSHMAGVLLDTWGDGGGGFFMDASWSLALDSLEHALREASRHQIPVLLLSTAFALVHWLDTREGRAPHILPAGSRLMETGGFKGRVREVPRDALYERASGALGIPQRAIVNEYGMTEMLSQFYEPVLVEGDEGGLEARRLVGPPWVRTRILDPVDLSPVLPGAPGLLAHLDLANLDSAAYLLTEDLGVEVPAPSGSSFPQAGFRLLGRNPGSMPRGCSLSLEAWLEARGQG